jgi:hypothetical protein
MKSNKLDALSRNHKMKSQCLPSQNKSLRTTNRLKAQMSPCYRHMTRGILSKFRRTEASRNNSNVLHNVGQRSGLLPSNVQERNWSTVLTGPKGTGVSALSNTNTVVTRKIFRQHDVDAHNVDHLCCACAREGLLDGRPCQDGMRTTVFGAAGIQQLDWRHHMVQGKRPHAAGVTLLSLCACVRGNITRIHGVYRV